MPAHPTSVEKFHIVEKVIDAADEGVPASFDVGQKARASPRSFLYIEEGQHIIIESFIV